MVSESLAIALEYRHQNQFPLKMAPSRYMIFINFGARHVTAALAFFDQRKTREPGPRDRWIVDAHLLYAEKYTEIVCTLTSTDIHDISASDEFQIFLQSFI